MLRAFGKHTLEAHVCYLLTDVIAVYKGGITQHLGRLSEISFHLLTLSLHLSGEALMVDK